MQETEIHEPPLEGFKKPIYVAENHVQDIEEMTIEETSDSEVETNCKKTAKKKVENKKKI